MGGPVHSYQEVASKALDGWLARGYAVVAPDYQGLGTLGAHPYMNAKANCIQWLMQCVHYICLSPRALINSGW